VKLKIEEKKKSVQQGDSNKKDSRAKILEREEAKFCEKA